MCRPLTLVIRHLAAYVGLNFLALIIESFGLVKVFKCIESNHYLTLLRLNLVPHHHISAFLKYLQGWGFDHLFGQPVLVFKNPFKEQNFLMSNLNLPWYNLKPFPLVNEHFAPKGALQHIQDAKSTSTGIGSSAPCGLELVSHPACPLCPLLVWRTVVLALGHFASCPEVMCNDLDSCILCSLRAQAGVIAVSHHERTKHAF